jgi:DNA-binding NtrC family response regulator
VSEAKYPSAAVLIVDDSPDVVRGYASILRGQRVTHVEMCSDSRIVEPFVAQHDVEVVLLDLNMPGIGGEGVLAMLGERRPEVPVIVVTGVDEAETAVRCMKRGAFDYLVKPVSADALLAAVRRAIDVREMRRENESLRQHVLRDELLHPEAFADIVTASRTMRDVFKYLEAVAGTSQPVLITGETGVGKDLIAQALHRLSGRSGRFVAVNISGVDDNVFADTLFGHLRGAFTGADGVRRGLVEQAEAGTLFLDEIGELSIASQVKLLRLVQQHEYFPIGSDEPRHTTARVVVATNRSPRRLLDEGRFREDLYFRLRSHHVEVPPLRARTEDIPVLLRHFTAKAARDLGKPVPQVAPGLLGLLMNYKFPGNVREMESLVYEAVTHHAHGALSPAAFGKAIGAGRIASDAVLQETAGHPADTPFGQVLAGLTQLPSLRDAEVLIAREALRRANGNQTAAALMLNVSRQTMNRYAGLERRGRRQGR